MSFTCPGDSCGRTFDDERDMLIHYTDPSSHVAVQGTMCPTCRHFVSFDQLVDHAETHIKNRDQPIAPIVFKVSCL